MQNRSDPEPSDTTRAGGPDDTRTLETPDEKQEQEKEVSTEEKDLVWR